MGDYLIDELHGLMDKHAIIGEVRGKGLLAGFELVRDRDSQQPVDETYVMRVAAHCKKQGLLIGRTNRSLPNNNNTVCLTPALIAGRSDIDQMVGMLDKAMDETPLG